MTHAVCRRPLFACRMIYWSSPAVVVLGRPAPTFLTTVPHVVWNAFQAREMTLLLIPNSAATLVTVRPSSSFPIILPRVKSSRKGPVYYELLKQGKTINANLYCSQLDKLNAAINEKTPALASRKEIVFHHDHARPHTTIVTQQKLNASGWEVVGHPTYAPDIAPSD
ncbi:mariner Mos1 transposase [Trichonephila clavipes]|nr:mariner Mos1 transposase [Trichonephila clavipes]